MTADEHSYRTQSLLSCDSQIGSPEMEASPLCGCGPNLIRCLRDDEQYDDLNRSFMEEVKLTTAYVVKHDLPMASLFTSNATFRDRNAELYYRRQKIGALELQAVERELADLARWPEAGMWAPRPELTPGQHAGLLTSPQLLHWLPDRRQRQRGYYEVMWCNLRNSFGATTHKVLEINTTGNNFFTHDSWQRLAHTDLCTDCHARLDYGSRFFMGYPDSRASAHFSPSLAIAGSGPLYGQDIRDRRGEAPLTPHGFATLATAQPDFKSCMTRHFASYVLGDRATAEDVREIEAVVAEAGTFKPPMKRALELYAERWRAESRAVSAPRVHAASAARGANGAVQVTAAMRTILDEHCLDCHDRAPYNDTADSPDVPFDFRGQSSAPPRGADDRAGRVRDDAEGPPARSAGPRAGGGAADRCAVGRAGRPYRGGALLPRPGTGDAGPPDRCRPAGDPRPRALAARPRVGAARAWDLVGSVDDHARVHRAHEPRGRHRLRTHHPSAEQPVRRLPAPRDLGRPAVAMAATVARVDAVTARR